MKDRRLSFGAIFGLSTAVVFGFAYAASHFSDTLGVDGSASIGGGIQMNSIMYCPTPLVRCFGTASNGNGDHYTWINVCPGGYKEEGRTSILAEGGTCSVGLAPTHLANDLVVQGNASFLGTLNIPGMALCSATLARCRNNVSGNHSTFMNGEATCTAGSYNTLEVSINILAGAVGSCTPHSVNVSTSVSAPLSGYVEKTVSPYVPGQQSVYTCLSASAVEPAYCQDVANPACRSGFSLEVQSHTYNVTDGDVYTYACRKL